MMFKKINILINTLVFLLVSLAADAQKKSFAGILLNTNIYPDQISLTNSSIGATYETQFRKRSGGETGVFYRTERSTEVATYTDASGSHSFSFTVARHYINFPLLYKYYSSHVNFSAGPTFDFYSGWRQKDDGSPYKVQSYIVSQKFKVGFLGKVSKAFLVNQNIVVEPEIRVGSVQTFDELNLGIGVAAKHKF